MRRLLLLPIVALLCCLGMHAASYGVTVKGVTIDDSNRTDVLNDGGTVSATMYGGELVITLNNAKIVRPNMILYVSDSCPASFVTVRVNGDNTFTAYNNMGAIYTEKPIEFTGKGKLTVQAGSYAIMSRGHNVAISTNLDIDAPTGITSTGIGILDFTSTCAVNIKETTYGAITDFSQIRFSGVEVLQPASYSVAGGSLKDKSGNIYKGVVKIGKNEPEPEPEVKYGVSIAGTEVTNKNCNDVLGGGTVSAEVAGSNMTITYKDASLQTSDPFTEMLYVEEGCKYDVTVKVVGNCTFDCKGPSIFAPRLVIQGTPGSSLTMTSKDNYAMNIHKGDLIIRDMPQMSITGDNGAINGNDGGYLNIFNSTLTIKDTDTFSPAAIKGFKALNLTDCGLLSPKGGTFKNGRVYDKDGNLYKGVVEIGPARKFGLTIAGTEVTSANCDDVLGDGTVSVYDRMDLGRLEITLDGANITSDGYAITVDPSAKIEYLDILTEGASSITSTGSSAIYVPEYSYFGYMSIRGSIDIKAKEYGVFLGNGRLIVNYIDKTNIKSGKACLYSANQKELSISNVTELTLTPTDGESSAIEGFGELELGDAIAFKPSTLKYDESFKVLVQGNVKYTGSVSIGKLPIFSCFKIDGKAVLVADADDVLGDGTLKIKTDEKNGEFILVMNNCDLDGGNMGITFSYDDSKYNSARIVANNSRITANWYDIISDLPLTINGSLALSVKEKNGTAIYASELTIEDADIDVTIHDDTAFDGYGIDPLTIRNSHVHIKGNPTCNPITNFGDLILDGVQITKPAGATYIPDEGLDVSKIAGFDGEIVVSVIADDPQDVMPDIAGTYYAYDAYYEYEDDDDEEGYLVTESMKLTIGKDGKAVYTVERDDNSKSETTTFDFSNLADIKADKYICKITLPNEQDEEENKVFYFVVVNGKVEACVMDNTILSPNKEDKFSSISFLKIEPDTPSHRIHFWDLNGNLHDWFFDYNMDFIYGFNLDKADCYVRFYGKNTLNPDYHFGMSFGTGVRNAYIKLPGYDDSLVVNGFTEYGIDAVKTNLFFQGKGSIEIADPSAEAAIYTYRDMTICDEVVMTLTAKSAFSGIECDEVEIVRQPAKWDITEESGYETYTLVREDREDAITTTPQAAEGQCGVRKFMKDGKIVILHGDKLYNTSGVQVK